ncbi:MAG: 5'-nucleotidase C-terminal domain-containing protein [Nitrospirae bacterium]|nr:5'-nucleotidase C-terminal domain-containing protein [Nitrospirota bacterium]
MNTASPGARLIIIAAILFGFLTYGIADSAGDIYTLSIAHINDTHGHLEPSNVPLTYNSRSFTVRAGGFPRIAGAVAALRESHPNFLFLHAGDVFTGTVFFSKYHGLADVDFLNAMRLDAMASGNHEFDKGPSVFAGFIKKASFPIVSANVELSTESPLYGLIKPYTIIENHGRKIGIVGLTTTDTPSISKPGKSVKFNDIIKSAQASISALTRQGVNIIIVLSHVGYENDLVLAHTLSDVDVIVGGHSHTLLGDDTLGQTGLNPIGPYPTEVRGRDNSTVVVVTAWEFGKILGLVDIDFDGDGKIVSYRGSQTLILSENAANTPEAAEFYESISSGKITSNPRFQIVKEDPVAALKLDNYTAPIKNYMQETIAYAEETIARANNQGPGPIITDSMLQKTAGAGAVIAIMNSGGVRIDLPKGNVSIADATSLMPFNNTIYVLKLKGYQIKDAIESTIDFQISKMKKPPFIYASGLRFAMDLSKPKGRRVEGMEIKARDTRKYVPVKMDAFYKIALSEYIAKGGDSFKPSQGTEAVSPLKAASSAVDTGFIDSEVFIEYIKSLKKLKNPIEQRIRMVQ